MSAAYQRSIYNCQWDNLGYLPDDISDEVKTLDCANNWITSIDYLPRNLLVLSCGNNYIRVLCKLPNSLEKLNCYGNNIESIPDLKDNINLRHIDFSQNKLKELPELPEKLDYFDCFNNFINKMPELPKTLNYFECSQNNLKELPELPENLETFCCVDNPLEMMPKLPESVERIYFSIPLLGKTRYIEGTGEYEWLYKDYKAILIIMSSTVLPHDLKKKLITEYF